METVEELKARIKDLESQRDILLLLVLTQGARVRELEAREVATILLEGARRAARIPPPRTSS